MARWQYQDSVEPLTGFPEVITVDKWYQTLSIPVIAPDGVNTYTGSSAFVAEPSGTEVITVDKWYQLLSIPVAEPDDAGDYTGSSVFVSEPTDLVPAEVITVDKWYQLLSVPIVVLPASIERDLGFTVDPDVFFVPDFDSWYVQLAIPTLPPDRVHASAVGVFIIEPDDFAVIIVGPYYILEAETFAAGAHTFEVFAAGGAKAEVHTAGAVAHEVT